MLDNGCEATIHGPACPVLGGSWAVRYDLMPNAFFNGRNPEPRFVPAIEQALRMDIGYGDS